MNKIEAKEILREVAELYRSRSHSDLTNMIEGFIWMTRKGESETKYRIQVCAFIDDEKTGNVRCVISIDGGSFFQRLFL